MRLLTWNIRDLLGDPLAVHRVVRAAAPDVACFQEAPRRPGAALRLRLLERGTGLRFVAGGRRSGGTAIFVAPQVEVSWARAFRLQVPGRFARTRGASVAEVHGTEVGSLVVASVHLPLAAALRLQHAEQTGRVLAWRGLPAVVAGDLNEPAGSAAWRAWEPLVADPWPIAGPTFPAAAPAVRIDAVLIGAGLRVTRYDDAGVRADDVRRASDHLPVLAVIERDR
ncbi:MAG TPA: endonuclease/exonuclease/phosphatase family protein [Kineosporiaceae bacterium]|nr:endonuclease/exonuclease/phosphatase family protein [Kineosporiaceae bacterium]